MKQKGVDFVETCMDINESIVLAKEMQKQGLDAVQQLPNGYDQDSDREQRRPARGLDRRSRSSSPSSRSRRSPRSRRTSRRWRRSARTRSRSRRSAGSSPTSSSPASKLAGPEFSQQKVIDGLNTLTDYSDNGFIPPIDWTKQHNDPATHPERTRHAGVRELHAGEGRQVRRRVGRARQAVGVLPGGRRRASGKPTYKTFVPEGSN